MASGKYKLLLVDDERDVLEAISAAVPWEKYDIQLVGLCDNAIEALKQIQRETPDLVITDVKMPVVNGIELIFQARQQGCDAEFIVLSGFDEFEFAQSAMSQGVRYYLLKPCSEEELAGALLKAIKDRDHHLRARKAVQFKTQFLEEVADRFVPSLWKNQEVSGLLDRLLEGEERKLYLAVFDRGDFPLSSQIWERDRSWRGFLLPPLLVLEHHFCTLWITGEVRQPEPALQDLATFFGVESPQMVPVTFQNLFDQVEAAEDKMCYFYHLNGEQEVGSDDALLELVTQQVEDTLQLEEDKRCQRLGQILREQGETLLAVAVARVLLKRDNRHSLFSQLFSSLYEEKGGQAFLDRIIEVLHDAAEDCREQKQSFVKEILEYIDNHLDDSNLTLRRIANQVVFRHEDYVGKAFYAYTGENFSTYLNRQRIERAKYLIQTMGDYKFYKVADQIGLGNNPHYFSKLFKKYTGMTPREYKRFCDGQEK